MFGVGVRVSRHVTLVWFGHDEGMYGMKWTGSNEFCGMSCKIQRGYSPRLIERKSFLGLSTFWIDVIRGRNSCLGQVYRLCLSVFRMSFSSKTVVIYAFHFANSQSFRINGLLNTPFTTTPSPLHPPVRKAPKIQNYPRL